MTGYNHQAGMSENAVSAYETGRKPLSKITVADLHRAGWQDTRKLAVSLARMGFWNRSEWHHSGGTWYNEVDFYDPEDLVEYWDELSTADKQKLKEKARKDKPECESVAVTGKYAEWGGSRKHPKIIGYVEFTGTLSGNWITTDKGNRKKADGRWIEYQIVQEGN